MLNKAQGRGFTLIELLVVIAIIAILAAILFPVFAQARKQAYKAVGQSNCKQSSLAILMYSQDYDEKMPRAGWGCNAGGDLVLPLENSCGATEWQNVTAPYVKATGIYANPGDGSDAEVPRSWGGTDLNADDGHFSFLYNDLLAHTLATLPTGFADANNQDPGTPRLASGLAQAAINAPADCVMLMEGHGGWNKANLSSSSTALDTPTAGGKTCRQDLESKFCKEQSISGYQTILFNYVGYNGGHDVSGLPFYTGGGNVAFCDGHVKFTRYADGSGKPILCSSLPWTKHLDPQQRMGDDTADYCGGLNPPGNGPGGTQSNWN